MAGEGKKLSEIYHEQVESLKASGVSNADAIRQVAEQLGKTERTVRAGIHGFRSRHGGDVASAKSRVRRQSPMSVEDAIASARGVLERALAGIDGDVEAAKAELQTAQRRYDELVASAEARKSELQTKIRALL